MMRRLKYPNLARSSKEVLPAPKPQPKPPKPVLTLAAIALEEKVLSKPKRKPKKKTEQDTRNNLEQAKIEVARMREEKDFSRASGRHYVALFAWLHNEVYGVEAEELLDGMSYAQAVVAADKRLKVEFGNDPEMMLSYMRWVWAREKKSEQNRTGDSGRRIGWQLMFRARPLLTDFRVAKVRQGKRASSF